MKIEEEESIQLYSYKDIIDKVNKKILSEVGVNKDNYLLKYLYITHLIIEYKENFKIDINDNFNGVRICTEILSEILGVNNSSKLLKNLIDWNIICLTEDYIIKDRCKSYDICPEVNVDEFYIMIVKHSDYPMLVNKICIVDNLKTNSIEKKLDYILKNYITLNSEGILYLENVLKVHPDKMNPNVITLGNHQLSVYSMDRHAYSLFKIHKKLFRTTRPVPGSRVYSNLTSLKRELRQYINFDEMPLMMTDISCSQILLSVEVILRQYSIFSGKGRADIPRDVLHFKELAEQGLFYDFISDTPDCYNRITVPKERKQIKVDFFKDIFFSKVASWTTPTKDMFLLYFPSVADLINQLKKESHSEFSIKLQKFEASVLVDHVAKKLIKEGRKILTLHDAIIANNEEDLSRAEELIKERLARLPTPLYPHLKRENNKTLRDIYSDPKEVTWIEFFQNSVKFRCFNDFIEDLGNISIDEFNSLLYLLCKEDSPKCITMREDDYNFSTTFRNGMYEISYMRYNYD